jgi:fatty acid-binding protein DegV
MKGMIGKLLGVKPVVFVNDEGKGDTLAKAFTEKGTARIVIKQIKAMMETNKVWNYAITHFSNQSMANWYSDEIKKLTGKDPLYITELTPVLSIHGGPGLVTISVLAE